MAQKPQRVTAVAGVISRAVGDEFVVIHPTTQTAYALRGATAAAWRAVQTGELVVEANDEALAELQAFGLVEVGSGGVSRRRLLMVGGAATVGLGILAVPLPAAAQASSSHGGKPTCTGVTPPSGPPGTHCRVGFSGFPPGPVTITCGGNHYTGTAGADGTGSCDFVLPTSGLNYGPNPVILSCQPNYTATGSFQCTESTPTPTPTPTPSPSSSAPPKTSAWNASTVYNTGDSVTYNGSTWTALYWTQDQTPGDPNGPWQQMETAPDGTALWTASRVFNAGDIAEYNSKKYVAQWYTRDQVPTTPNGPWTLHT